MAVGQVQHLARTDCLVLDTDMAWPDSHRYAGKWRVPFRNRLAIDPGRPFAAGTDQDPRQCHDAGRFLLLCGVATFLDDGLALGRIEEQRPKLLARLCQSMNSCRGQGQQQNQLGPRWCRLWRQRDTGPLFNHFEGAAGGGVRGWLKKRKVQLAFKPLLLGDHSWQDWTLNLPLTCCS